MKIVNKKNQSLLSIFKTSNALLFIAFLFFNTVNAADVNFYYGGLEKAKLQAKAEGKHLLVDFHAKWCTPCKWMDQTTFKDKQVIDVLKKDFVSVKIDIDDFEGFELKSKYNVRYLPTIIIFNEDGVMVQRIEETLTPTKLTEILTPYQIADRKVSVQKEFTNVSPDQLKIEAKKSDDLMMTSEEYRDYFSQPAQSTYRLQMGAFSNFDGAQTKVNALREEFLEPIVVITDKRNDKEIYRVMMGQFQSMEEADSFRKILKNSFGLDSIIN